ncbi:MAG: hypothetical protein CVU71_01035 [Deltaproteobacteria bacterium HGW-Deltaproteobacteria-6]|nr:MAG: hypothetical protein CVU71_01035 [Deltaproteobacteria bacterium HGW-Deltaproteobacteria-6]
MLLIITLVVILIVGIFWGMGIKTMLDRYKRYKYLYRLLEEGGYMGALPRLKKKVELKYRKGSTDDGQNCRYCTSYVKDFEVIGIGGIKLDVEPRCQIIGLENSRRYRVRPDYTCNAQVRDDAKCWWIKRGASNA